MEQSVDAPTRRAVLDQLQQLAGTDPDDIAFTLDDAPPDAFAKALSTLLLAYVARREAGVSTAIIDERLNASDVIALCYDLLAAQDLGVFELSMWAPIGPAERQS